MRGGGPFDALGIEPDAPHIVAGPTVADVVTPPELAVAIVDAVFQPAIGTRRKVQFAGQTARISEIREDAGDQAFGFADALSIRAQAGGVRVAAAEKAGPRRRADRILHEGMGEGDRLLHEPAEIRSPDVRVVQALDGIEALLICADPEDIWHLTTVGAFGRRREQTVRCLRGACGRQ